MNRNFIIFTLAAATYSGLAMADDISVDRTPFASDRARAQVRAEFEDFKRAGANPWSTQFNPLAGFQSDRTRGAALAEYLSQREISDAKHAEHGGSAALRRVAKAASNQVAASADQQ